MQDICARISSTQFGIDWRTHLNGERCASYRRTWWRQLYSIWCRDVSTSLWYWVRTNTVTACSANKSSLPHWVNNIAMGILHWITFWMQCNLILSFATALLSCLPSWCPSNRSVRFSHFYLRTTFIRRVRSSRNQVEGVMNSELTQTLLIL